VAPIHPPENIVSHFAELRKRLLIAAAAWAVASAAAYPFSGWVLDRLLEPLRSVSPAVYFTAPADAFMVRFRLALTAGVLIASPVLIAQLWLFVSPGLYGKEKKIILPLLAVISFFFIAGALFAFFIVLPPTLDFLMGYETPYLKPLISIGEYVSFAGGFVLAFGVAFNLPVAVALFSIAGLVRHSQLVEWRKFAVVLLFLAAAVLTPSPDVVSQLMLGVPLVLLYETGVVCARVIEAQKKRSAGRSAVQ
jgi:sec-independent protein translocase protein TatC